MKNVTKKKKNTEDLKTVKEGNKMVGRLKKNNARFSWSRNGRRGRESVGIQILRATRRVKNKGLVQKSLKPDMKKRGLVIRVRNQN